MPDFLWQKDPLKTKKLTIFTLSAFFICYDDCAINRRLYGGMRCFISFLPRKYGNFDHLKNVLAMRFLLLCT